jgi:hypothetical protein
MASTGSADAALMIWVLIVKEVTTKMITNGVRKSRPLMGILWANVFSHCWIPQ